MAFDFKDIGGLGSIADFASGIMDRFFPKQMDEKEKAAAQLAIQQMLEIRENALLETQKAVIVAEMSQGDAYTKRARPTIVYAGLLFIFLVHVALPCLAFFRSMPVPTLSLPEDFWWAWSGVCGIWMIGRSAEKTGNGNKLTKLITGGK